MRDVLRSSTRRGPALSRRAALAGGLQALALLAACTRLPPAIVTEGRPGEGRGAASPTPGTPPAPAGQAQGACPAGLPAAAAPTPLPYPGLGQEEPETGLHVTGPAHVIDPAAYRLEVTGKVERPLSLTFDEVRCLPKMAADVVLECPGLFFDPQNLGGTPLAGVLALVGPLAGAQVMRLAAADGYEREFPLAAPQAPEAGQAGQAPESFLAYELGGQLLPASHGFPLRAVFPGRVGSAWMKWLVRIEVG